MSVRTERIERLIIEELSDIIRKGLKDPRLGFVTFTSAKVTGDLRHARVNVSVLGNQQERDLNLTVLRNAAGFLRVELGKRIKIKTLPELDFRLDDSAEQGVRMVQLLDEISREENDHK